MQFKENRRGPDHSDWSAQRIFSLAHEQKISRLSPLQEISANQSFCSSASSVKKPTISVVIPALNEEKNIAAAIAKAARLVRERVSAYEIIAINDGSTDNTGRIIDAMSKEDGRIVSVHHEKPWGFGGTYCDGLSKARFDYFALVAGDNEELEEEQHKLYNNIGAADLILSYTTNQEVRSLDRRFISKSFVNFMNFAYGLNLRYYNGGGIIRTELLRNLKMHTFGFAYMSSNLVRLVKSGYSYREVGIKLAPTKKTSAYKLKNIISVAKEIVRLYIEVNVMDRRGYNKTIRCLNDE